MPPGFCVRNISVKDLKGVIEVIRSRIDIERETVQELSGVTAPDVGLYTNDKYRSLTISRSPAMRSR
jgi:hypothetical protein